MEWPPIAGDPRFFQRSGPHSLAAVVDAAEANAPPRRLMLTGVAPLQTAEPDKVSFLGNRKYAAALDATRAGAVIVHPDMAEHVRLIKPLFHRHPRMDRLGRCGLGVRGQRKQRRCEQRKQNSHGRTFLMS